MEVSLTNVTTSLHLHGVARSVDGVELLVLAQLGDGVDEHLLAADVTFLDGLFLLSVIPSIIPLVNKTSNNLLSSSFCLSVKLIFVYKYTKYK